MHRLFRWLTGYVRFTFSDGFCEGFINDCKNNSLNVYRIKRVSNTVTAECPSGLYPSLRRLAKKNGGRLRIDKKIGLPFYLYPLKNRYGLLAGLLACVIIICFLEGFIWNIELVGNEKISDVQLLTFLEKNGLHEGAYFNSVDRDYIETLALASFEDCAWIHINRSGTTARVEIREAEPKPEMTDETGVYNVKAAKDGLIVKATVHSGWAVKNKGDSVVKGDLLISGVYTGEQSKANVFTHARGEYIAEVKEPFSLTVSRTQSFKAYKAERVFKSIVFFGLRIPLYIGNSNVKDSDVSEDYSYIKLNSERLPIGIYTKKVKPYEMSERELSDSELGELLQSEIEKKLSTDFKDFEIVKQDIQTSLDYSSASASGTVICREDISQEIKIADEVD